MRWMRALVVTALVAALGGAAAAQAPGQTAPVNSKIEKVKQQILAFRAALLTEELSLDPDTAARLAAVLGKYDPIFVRLLKDNADLRKRAQAAAAANDDKTLDDLIDKLVANQRARWDAQEQRFKDVRTVLSAKQAARILVVLPQIDRMIQNKLRRALRGGGPGPGMRRRGRGGGGGGAAASGDDDDDGGGGANDDDGGGQDPF